MADFYSSGQIPGNDQGSSQYGSGGFEQHSQQQPNYGFNAQQWQNPPQQGQQQQQQQFQNNQAPFNQQQQQQQQNYGGSYNQYSQNMQQSQPSFWNPATAGAVATAMAGGLNNDNMMDVGVSVGKTFVQSGIAKMIPGLETTMLTLRSYFAVDNNYVRCKMQKILFPFKDKSWKREDKEPSAGQDLSVRQYALPYYDVNAPDLYIPAMSLITYVLLCAFCYGTSGNFDPEVIPDVSTKCFVTQIVEVLAIRFGFHLMQANVSILDLFAYTGYKYLGLSINMLVGLLLGHLGYGHRGYYATFLWTASAAAFFMLKTMANNIPTITASTGPKREIMVFTFAGSQFATMYFWSSIFRLEKEHPKNSYH